MSHENWPLPGLVAVWKARKGGQAFGRSLKSMLPFKTLLLITTLPLLSVYCVKFVGGTSITRLELSNMPLPYVLKP
jgi:hypothetical protein